MFQRKMIQIGIPFDPQDPWVENNTTIYNEIDPELLYSLKNPSQFYALVIIIAAVLFCMLSYYIFKVCRRRHVAAGDETNLPMLL